MPKRGGWGGGGGGGGGGQGNKVLRIPCLGFIT